MKKEARSKVSDLIKCPDVDQTAQTTAECACEWGVRNGAARQMIIKLINEGRVEAVRKRVDGRLLPAYRTVKK